MITSQENAHTFHIPVMGTGFTLDTPLAVAKLGISSVISLGDDVLIEQMRKFHTERIGEPYEEIKNQDEDARARRITLYLNLIDRLVREQLQRMRTSPFSPDSDIVRYFELLPDRTPKQLYQKMLQENDPVEKNRLQDHLRTLIAPGSIDVNIMTKLDKENYRNGEKLPSEYRDARAALRGFAKSNLRSSIIFSAGINTHLYSYISQFSDFFPEKNGSLKKKVVLKVSDFRSAEVQGRFLAKHGIWVSEYRIESGLNCGGHAFPTTGILIGPILEQFKNERHSLIEELFTIYRKALAADGHTALGEHPAVKFTVQGGIGSYAENKFLLEYYEMDSTGWGTPFLLVPEVTNMDKVHIDKLLKADKQDVYLSNSSPLGVPFWNLHDSGSETARLQRIKDGRPGSPCPKGILVSNTEFTEKPICLAAWQYQKNKLKSLDQGDYTAEQLSALKDNVLSKSCLCNDLAGTIKVKNDIEPEATPAICSGPNIKYFSRIATLEEMVNHIYGRGEKLTSTDRPHMFIEEARLYVEYLRDEIEKYLMDLSTRKQKYFSEFKENLQNGIDYYRHLTEVVVKEEWDSFLDDLKSLYYAVETLDLEPIAVTYNK